MKNTFASLFFLLISLLTGGCEKEEIENHETLRMLYNTYENGEISECQLEGEVVYSAGINAADAPTILYDAQGVQIGKCDYAWGNVDAICEQLTACEVIYRVKDHISNLPAVDKYGLGH